MTFPAFLWSLVTGSGAWVWDVLRHVLPRQQFVIIEADDDEDSSFIIEWSQWLWFTYNEKGWDVPATIPEY